MAPNGVENDGGCKDESTSSKAADCVAKALKLDASNNLDKQAINMASREWRALRRPASEEVRWVKTHQNAPGFAVPDIFFVNKHRCFPDILDGCRDG